jgi:hypothetical protein
MPEVVFYRQCRVDGGYRTGVEVGGETVLYRFDPGGSDEDPALEWYVDLRFSGGALPGDPMAVREWLRQSQPEIVAALNAVAEDLQTGVDPNQWPLTITIPNSPRGTSMSITCSAVRRIAGRELGRAIRTIADEWGMLLARLSVFESSAS